MANPQIVKTPNPFTPEVNTKQARNKAIIGFSRFRPIGRVFQITAVKIVHLLTILSVPASGWPGPGLPASASGIQSSFRQLTSPQSSEAFHQTSFLPTYFERWKLSTRKNYSLNCKLYPISIHRAVWCRVPVQ
jgi:hypothetical protein